MPPPRYILALLLTVCFTLTTWLQPLAANHDEARDKSQNLLGLVMGDAERLFAGLFFREADVYFHSGYYPSIFNQARTNEMHIAEQAGKDSQGKHEEEEKSVDFLGPPRDWIEAFGRNFMNTKHTHLDETGKVGEMLPWLRMSADLDPHRVETYTVTAYWLRSPMHDPKDAEAFLREGMRANPDSYEILFELGRLYRDNYKDTIRARNIFQLAERKLEAQEKKSGEPDLFGKREILVALARLEEKEGNIAESIRYLQQLHDAFPTKNQAVRQEFEGQIEELQQRLRAPASR